MKTLLHHAAEILVLMFLVITFLQSGLDKLMDWSGNRSWLTEHFSKTRLKHSVPLLLGIVLLAELLAAILCLGGIYQLLADGEAPLGLYGGIVSCITLLMLLFGQRVAKDYEGAKTIAIYFIPALFLVFMLQS